MGMEEWKLKLGKLKTTSPRMGGAPVENKQLGNFSHCLEGNYKEEVKIEEGGQTGTCKRMKLEEKLTSTSSEEDMQNISDVEVKVKVGCPQ